jgi:hypothetical protein
MIDDDAAAEAMVERTAVRSLGVKDGQVVLDMVAPHELVVAMASAMAESLGDAPNYAETAFSVRDGERPDHDFVLTVHRRQGLTPHELRRQAEAERDAALANRRPLAWVVLEWCDDGSRVVVSSELYPVQGLAEAAAQDLTRDDECGCRYTVAALTEGEAE